MYNRSEIVELGILLIGESRMKGTSSHFFNPHVIAIICPPWLFSSLPNMVIVEKASVGKHDSLAQEFPRKP